MRTVVMDPGGNVVDEQMIPLGTMLPTKSYITRTPAGEVVQVLQIDPEHQPQGVWNMMALG